MFFRVRLSDPSTGDATDPTTQDPVDDASIVLTVYAPDGTNSTPALTHPSTGVYTASTTVSQIGQWTYATQSTGAAAGAAKQRFSVNDVP